MADKDDLVEQLRGELLPKDDLITQLRGEIEMHQANLAGVGN